MKEEKRIKLIFYILLFSALLFPVLGIITKHDWMGVIGILFIMMWGTFILYHSWRVFA